MNKKQKTKKLNNKGFSLVELIVVIAIMAVPVGVLAPTPIRNVEKSRESTDLQTLDSVRGCVTTALSVESVNADLGTGYKGTLSGGTLTEDASSGAATTFNAKLQTELSDDGVLSAKLKSKACGSSPITITITADGKVKVEVVGVDSTKTKSKIDMVAE